MARRYEALSAEMEDLGETLNELTARASPALCGARGVGPEGHEKPSDYWISNLPDDSEPEKLARLARLRWKVELDYKQLKGELGLDHYEGRSYLGWYHHTALVTAAHGFLTLERQNPNHPRPA